MNGEQAVRRLEPRALAVAVVVDDPGMAARAEALLDLSGWACTDDVPSTPWCLGGRAQALVATVAQPDDAARLIEARLRGVAVVAVVADPELRARVVADLGRVGPVIDEPDDGPDPVTLLDPSQLGLLVALGNGASTRDAARQQNVSVRTAYRRIDAARATLGDVPLGAAVGRVLAAQAARRSVEPPALAAAALVGRDEALAQARATVEGGGSVLVRGPAGAGVSSTVRAAVSEESSRVRLVWGFDLCRGRPGLAVAALLGSEPRSGAPRSVARELARALAGQIVVVDDAQWLDGESAAALEQVATEVPVVWGWIDGPDPGRGDGGEAAAPPAVDEVIELAPLAGGDARALVVAVDGVPPDVVDDVVREGRGLPGALLAAARRAAADGGLDARVATEVGRLSSDARRVLARSVAAGGLLAATDVPIEVRRQLDALPTAVVADDGSVVLRPTVLASVRPTLAVAEVEDAHRWVAEHSDDPAAATLHWMAAGEPGRARRLALAELAADAPDLSTPRRADLQAVLARTAPPAERAPATAAAARALAEAGRVDDAALLVADITSFDPTLLGHPRLVALRASLLVNQGATDEARAVVEAALQRDDLDPSAEVALRSVRGAALGLSGGAAEEVIAEAERAVSAGTDDDYLARMLRGAGMALAGDRAWPEVLLPGYDVALASGRTLEIAIVTEAAAQATFLYGDWEGADALLDRGLAALPEGDDNRRPLEVHRVTDEIIGRGPTDRALARAHTVLTATEPGRVHRAAWSILAMGLADRGRPAEADAALAQAEASPREPNGDRALAWARAEVALAVGQASVAAAVASEAASGPPTNLPAQAGAATTVRWAMLDGAPTTPVSRPVTVYPMLEPLVTEADALDALLADEPERAAELFARCTTGGMARNDRRNRWAQGEALRRAGREDAARRVLEDLAAEAEGADLPPLLARVRASLRRLGVVGGGPSGRHPSGLTTREVEVLVLVADGLSSPAIAARLHIARSTVDSLVGSARRKLGARTRREAAAVLVAQLARGGDD